jgi:hypothetical protein
MAGKNNRIHGYNIIYRENQQTKFQSFSMEKNGPSSFINRVIAINNSNDKILDHQGHIVPQNMLDLILNPLMKDMAECKDETDVKNFIKRSPWLELVYSYGKNIKAPMFDFSQKEPEDKVGNFFAIVTWNPVNICRAPEDAKRKDKNGKLVPGNKVDVQVRDYLANHRDEQGVNTDWLTSLQTLKEDETDKKKLENYIIQCCNILAGQEKKGIGYYSFPWEYSEDKNNPLIPAKN